MADFNKAYELLKRWENRNTKRGLIVYSDIKEDKGGETVLGVARNIHPNLPLWAEVDRIKKEVGLKDLVYLSKKLLENNIVVNDSKKLFKENYWDKMWCDIIEYQPFAENLFLLGVNAGVKRGIKTGQAACGIVADGIIGNNTKNAWKTAGIKETKNYTDIEIGYYKSIVDKNPKQVKFLAGWLNRANAV